MTTAFDPMISALRRALEEREMPDTEAFLLRHAHEESEPLSGVGFYLDRVYTVEVALEATDTGEALAHVATHSYADGRSGETRRTLGDWDEGLDGRWWSFIADTVDAIELDLRNAGKAPDRWELFVHPPLG